MYDAKGRGLTWTAAPHASDCSPWAEGAMMTSATSQKLKGLGIPCSVNKVEKGRPPGSRTTPARAFCSHLLEPLHDDVTLQSTTMLANEETLSNLDDVSARGRRLASSSANNIPLTPEADQGVQL